MDRSIRQRRYGAFLSHAHVNRQGWALLDDFLVDVAGLRIWPESHSHQPGGTAPATLGDTIDQCASMVVLLTEDAVRSGWVDEQVAAGHNAQAANREFSIIGARLDSCEVPDSFRGNTVIDVAGGELTVDAAERLLTALNPQTGATAPTASRDVYLIRTWRAAEADFADKVCRRLAGAGFRLIGDARDQDGFGDGDRQRSIMASCGAVAAILPVRGTDDTSGYMLDELGMAAELGLPTLVVADPAIAASDGGAGHFAVHTNDPDSPQLLAAIEELAEVWTHPAEPHYFFLATDFDEPHRTIALRLKRLIERITAMECVIGDQIRHGAIQATIVDSIRRSFAVIADISDDNLNTCIEAGIARGAGRNLHLIARGRRRRPPFMLRDLELFTYDDEVMLLGLIHKLARPYRRWGVSI